MDAQPVSASVLLLAVLAAGSGFVAGWLHFASLARIADMIVAGRLTPILFQLARLAGLGLFLWLCAMGGAAVLLAGAAGVLVARSVVLRRLP